LSYTPVLPGDRDFVVCDRLWYADLDNTTLPIWAARMNDREFCLALTELEDKLQFVQRLMLELSDQLKRI